MDKKNNKYNGSKEYFDLNWQERKEKTHNYFTTKSPQTQMQFAFKNHYELFKKLFFKEKRGKSLEVGCGRGNLSLYFANDNWETFLLDQSQSAINVAKENFSSLKLKGNFFVGDANNLPFEDASFDIVFSVGLLEHFENVEKTIKEQTRILKTNGFFIGYVVPKRIFNVQTFFKPLNKTLSFFKKIIDPQVDKFKKSKDLLFRSDYNSKYYLDIMEKENFSKIGSFGIFPVPLISYSDIYPFTPLPKTLEKTVVFGNKFFLQTRKIITKNPWSCSELWGQAFVVWGIKK
jgi:ubiquinone/menaquinone biosynthesis C-methylase UbiE